VHVLLNNTSGGPPMAGPASPWIFQVPGFAPLQRLDHARKQMRGPSWDFRKLRSSPDMASPPTEAWRPTGLAKAPKHACCQRPRDCLIALSAKG